MKKFLSLVLALILALSVCACDGIGDIAGELADVVISGLNDELTGGDTYLDDEPTGGGDTYLDEEADGNENDGELEVSFGESYSSKDEVALYLNNFSELPPNYITKQEAQKLGWSGGGLEKYAPGKCIGGDRFGNYEGLLPEKDGRKYTECDIDTLGESSRGAKRIVFSNDGLIYYTDDHYETFTLLYGEENQ